MFKQLTNRPEETVVQKIYRLAKENNVPQLNEMVREGVCLGVTLGQFNAVMLLAKEGEVEAVELLIQQFNASRNDATRGYAMGGYVNEVNKQIALGAKRDDAAFGYAFAGLIELAYGVVADESNRNFAAAGFAMRGDVEQVNKLISEGASLDFAARGFAMSRHVTEANELIGRGANPNFALQGFALGGYVDEVNEQIAQGANRDFAVWGYAFAGLTDEVNKQIGQGANRDYAVGGGYARGGHVGEVNQFIAKGVKREYAVRGYAIGFHVIEVNKHIAEGANKTEAVLGYRMGGHLEEMNLLRLMSLTDNEELRTLLANEANKKIKSLDIPSLLIEARKLNRLIVENNLTFEQAKGYVKSAANNWLFQGQQLVREGQFPAEIYFHILSFVLGLSESDTQCVFVTANRRLQSNIVVNTLSLFQPAEEKIVAECKQIAEDRYQKRITF